MPASAAPVSRPAPATVVGAANGASVGPARGGEDAGVLRTPERRPPAPAREPLIGPPAERRRSSGGLRFGLLVGILLVIGAVAAVIIVTSGTGSQSAAQSPSSNSPGAGGGFDPAHVTVAVLNGTATNQLAHKVAAHLAALGYQEGRIATASDQAVTATTVAYLAGAGDRNAALHVAKALNLNRSSVVPINQDAEAVACPPPGSCTANVVVTVGADLAQT